MADPNTRQGKRTPVTLKIKFKSETLEQFIERYAVDVSQGGIFIRTKEPLAVGTQMKFEFQLRDASPLIAGEGTVVWTRENDPSRPAIAPGMGVRFDRLADGSQTVLEKILAEKAKQAPQRGASEGASKPPMFTDTPTKVAPAPVQEALGVGRHRAKSDSEQTPLPPPRPFHSDADDFDEKAFEEATKVRSLDELAAQTAGLIGGSAPRAEDPAADDAPTNSVSVNMPPDELAARRAGKPERADSLGEPTAPPAAKEAVVDRESAPGLPEPPPATRSKPPSDTPATSRTKSSDAVKAKAEPAKAQARAAAETPKSDLSIPSAPQRKSAAPIVILLLVLVAGAGGLVWWFVVRPSVAEKVVSDPQAGSAGSAGSEGSSGAVATPGSDTGSDGSAVPQTFGANGSAGSDGSAGSAAVQTPTVPTVDTVIAANVAKGATVEIVGTDQKGPAPFTAKLEKDKAYKARVTAPGFTPTEIAIKGGADKTTAKLVAKPHLITVTTDPPGADIYVDGVNTQKITPSEVQLTNAQAAKPRVRISLRRPGYRPVDQVIEASAFKDGDSQMTASVNAKLAVVVRPAGGGTGSTGGTTGSGGAGAGSGSATPANGGGSGSATTGTSGTGTSGTGTSGTGTSGTGTSGTGTSGTGTSGTGTSGTGTSGTGTSGTGTSGTGTTPPAGGGGAGSATKPATGSGAAPSASAGGTATPMASGGDPEPTWTK